MNKLHIVRSVTEKIQTAENSIDASIADVSRLLIAMTEARQDLKLGAGAGSEAFARLGEAIAALNQARVATVAAHNELRIVQEHVVSRTSMDVRPGWQDSPPLLTLAPDVSERRAG